MPTSEIKLSTTFAINCLVLVETALILVLCFIDFIRNKLLLSPVRQTNNKQTKPHNSHRNLANQSDLN